jgi:hypothetical protein
MSKIERTEVEAMTCVRSRYRKICALPNKQVTIFVLNGVETCRSNCQVSNKIIDVIFYVILAARSLTSVLSHIIAQGCTPFGVTGTHKARFHSRCTHTHIQHTHTHTYMHERRLICTRTHTQAHSHTTHTCLMVKSCAQ